MPRTLAQRRFGENHSLHLQDQRLRPANNQQKSGLKKICVFSGSGYFLVTCRSAFYPEYGNITVVRNTSKLLLAFRMSVSTRQHSPGRTLDTCRRGATTIIGWGEGVCCREHRLRYEGRCMSRKFKIDK